VRKSTGQGKISLRRDDGKSGAIRSAIALL
jgi:hypothetical protein